MHVRPINKNDIDEISQGNIVNRYDESSVDASILTKDTPISNNLFRKRREADSKVSYEDAFTNTAIIRFPVNVVNPFLAGKKCEIFNKLFSVSGSINKYYDTYTGCVEDLMYGKAVITKDGTIVKSQPGTCDQYAYNINKQDFYLGADAIQFMLDDVIDNLDSYIERVLLNYFILPIFPPSIKQEMLANLSDFGKIVDSESSDGWYLCDKYYFVPTDKVAGYKSLFDKNYSNAFMQSIGSNNSGVALLLSLRNQEAIDTLYGELMSYIFVLPIGYRESINGRFDSLSKLYNDLVEYVDKFKNQYGTSSISSSSLCSIYTDIVTCVKNIFVGYGAGEQSIDSNFRSILERLKGKEGLIRGRMQATRFDYSARSVITCDPNMPLDCVGIPESILGKLMEMEIIKDAKGKTLNASERNMAPDVHGVKHLKDLNRKAAELIQRGIESGNEYRIIIGRQPTLFYLSMQSFKIRVHQGTTFILSPLVVMPFNADFDGDQMHGSFPITEAAQKEVNEKMASTNNLYYPKNGSLTVTPRHEIQFGLWIALTLTEPFDGMQARTYTENDKQYIVDKINETIDYRNSVDKSAQFVIKHQNVDINTDFLKVIYEAVCLQVVAPYDIINAQPANISINLNGETAGHWALRYTIGRKSVPFDDESMKRIVVVNDTSVKLKASKIEKWFNSILSEEAEKIHDNGPDGFVTMVDRMTKLGFALANIYPPSISIINHINCLGLIDEFNKKMYLHEEYINYGIELKESYSEFFSKELEKLNAELAKYVLNELPEDSGYLRMAISKAKGNESNIMQCFATKGRIMKNDLVAFDTIIRNSLANQLTGLEHFITAYGARQGLADKVLATADPGYLTRLLEHAAAPINITTSDCGTSDGLNWTWWDLKPFVSDSTSVDSKNLEKGLEFTEEMFIGRFMATSQGGVKITKNNFKDLFKKYVADVDQQGELIIKEGMKVRSPLTCNNPCCAKCYGKDLTRNTELPEIGKNIGFIAAQSIGEPGTQLTMKNFQRGGVQSDANLTSAFDTIKHYFNLYGFSKDKAANGAVMYDPISPYTGEVITYSNNNGTKHIQIKDINGDIHNTSLNVFNDVRLKSNVIVGETLLESPGNIDVSQIFKYHNYYQNPDGSITYDKDAAYFTASKYLILKLYSIFNAESDVNAKHFEVIVTSMSSFITAENIDEFKAGEYLSLKEWNRVGRPTNGMFTLTSIKTLPTVRHDFLESIMMENQTTYVRGSIILNPEDSFTNPKTRLSFGATID